MNISRILISIIFYSFYVCNVESAECTAQQLSSVVTQLGEDVRENIKQCNEDAGVSATSQTVPTIETICQHSSCREFIQKMLDLEFPDCTVNGQNIADQQKETYKQLKTQIDEQCGDSAGSIKKHNLILPILMIITFLFY